MEVNCAGCAGCCLDWRALREERLDEDGSTRGAGAPADPRREPVDDDPTFVPLTREEVRTYLERGLAAALTPRFWLAADGDRAVELDGLDAAAVAGRPVFFVGLRKPPKPVAPFGRDEPAWLPTCVNLDPTTLQCRVHGTELFPDECAGYPEGTLALEQRTECERVEAAFGGDRLLEVDDPDPDGLLFGPQALGAKLFCHPDPGRLEGVVDRLAAGDPTAADRAECLAVAAASSPGTLAVSDHHYERARERALETMHAASGDDRGDEPEAGWIGPTIREWAALRERATGVPSPAVARRLEEGRGAPETPGWEGLE